MKNLQPQQPSRLSPYAQACLNALVSADLARHISLGGAFGLFHYLDYRFTQDDAWWSDGVSEGEKKSVVDMLKNVLSEFGKVNVRSWGDVVSVELLQEGKTVFSFQIAARSARIQESILAGWIDVPLDSLSDLIASKMVALVERGAPRDFLDIYSICKAGLATADECWSLWAQRQVMSGSDADLSRARLAIETHLERIALHRPLDQITDEVQRQQARQVREWFSSVFLKASNNER
ncbi:MAG TPA: nucleotidyl transferase AbiEii/AbiGii toxin family protein [Anaerolineales bacterium]|nr:nucleotidyl transferase AbiEii/AbiGii toxin family protein [Anaerolineales bacterium]